MPKGFSEREKAIIRANLQAKGKELFAIYGVKKTNVEELTRRAGISKGAFYLFYSSKEELFFELMEQFEAEFKAGMLRDVAEAGGSPRERFKSLLKHALTAWKTNPLFTRFDKEEYAYLLRKLPEERVQAHMRGDELSAGALIAELRRAGVTIDREPRMVSNMIKALFFISLHEDDFDADAYPDVIGAYIDLLAGYVIQE